MKYIFRTGVITLFTFIIPSIFGQFISIASSNMQTATQYEVSPTGWQCGTHEPAGIITAKFEPDSSTNKIRVSVAKCNGGSFVKNGTIRIIKDNTGQFNSWKLRYQTSTSSYRCGNGNIIEFSLVPTSEGSNPENPALRGTARKCDGGSFRFGGYMYIVANGSVIAGPDRYSAGDFSKSITFSPLELGQQGRHIYYAYFQSDNDPQGHYNISGGVDGWEEYHPSYLSISWQVRAGQAEASVLLDPASLGITGQDWHTYQVHNYPDGQDYPIPSGIISAKAVTVAQGDQYEPDNDFTQANNIGTNGNSQTHTTHIPGDEDWVTFEAQIGHLYIIETTELQGGSDTLIGLFWDENNDNHADLIVRDDDGGEGRASRIEWTATRTGTHYVKIRDFDENKGGANVAYKVRVTATSTTPNERYILVSSSSGGRVNNIAFQDEDILVYSELHQDWRIYFDGSDVGLGSRDVDAFTIIGNGILISLDRPQTIPGLGKVDDSDIIKFVDTQIGEDTVGSFEWYFDGSDVGLTKSSEDIDAISLLSGNRLLISTLGNAAVPGVSGVRDEDLLVFTMTQSGRTTKGTWSRYFDGSDVKLTKSGEDVIGASFDQSTNRLDMTTLGSFSVTGIRGSKADIFSCVPSSTGSNTRCPFNSPLTWDGSKFGFAKERVDGITVLSRPSGVVAAEARMSTLDFEVNELGKLSTVAIDAPLTEFVYPGTTTTISYTIANLGDVPVTYNLELTQDSDWNITEIPESITIGAKDEAYVTLDITPSLITEEMIILTATDQAASSNTTVDVSEISIVEFDQFVYLPVIQR